MKELEQLLPLIDGLLNTKSSSPCPLVTEIENTPLSKDLFLALSKHLAAEGSLHQSSRWAAHMTPHISASSLFGQLLSGLNNGNLLSPQLYPLLTAIEKQTCEWICQHFSQRHAHFTAGSSYANLEALWQAREQSNTQYNIVYGSRAAHYSIAKACQILGLDFLEIATDDQDRLSADALEHACQQQSPLAIIASAGTTACGAIDPLKRCGQIAAKYNAWFHVDAAWGGALALLPEHCHHLEGIAQANSINFDPHKALMQPKPSSILMYQRALESNTSSATSYLEQSPQQMLPGSRGGESFLPIWCTLMLDGVDSVRENLAIRLREAELFLQAVKPLCNWHTTAITGIVCFHFSEEVDISTLVTQGMFSTAKINNRQAYRAVFSAPSTKSTVLIEAIMKAHLSTTQ